MVLGAAGDVLPVVDSHVRTREPDHSPACIRQRNTKVAAAHAVSALEGSSRA